MLSVGTNIGSFYAKAAASSAAQDMDVIMERLATGKRINAARDDAAGVAISSRLESNIRGLNQAVRNALDAQTLLDTAEGGLQEVEVILQRIRELAVQAANDTNLAADRSTLQSEVLSLLSEINRVAKSTAWAGQTLLDGTFTQKYFQVGSSSSQEDQVRVDIGGSRVADLFSVPEQVFSNSTFDNHSFDALGNLKVPGWSIFNSQIVMGKDGAPGSSVVADYPTPSDPTPRPTNGSAQTSRGDAYSPASASYSSTIENGSFRFLSSMTTSAGGDVVHCPFIVSDDQIFISEGATVSFDWQAKGGSDAYDVFAYLVNVDTGETQVLLDQTGSSSGDRTPVINQEILVESSGNYKFVFVSGTFDYSFGRAAGASIYIDNITVKNNKAVSGVIDLTSNEGCHQAIFNVDAALAHINEKRTYMGSKINRLDHAVSNNTNVLVNTQASLGRIMDVDYALESTRLTKHKILQQASVAMLAQANASKQSILQLLDNR